MADDATDKEMTIDKVERTSGREEQALVDEEEMEIDKEQPEGHNNDEYDNAHGEGEQIGAEEHAAISMTSIDRPTQESPHEYRAVEALLDASESANTFSFQQGHVMPLQVIPNVAHKLSKKWSPDLKLLHQALFGVRKGKVSDFKNHILQFFGFTWHEGEEQWTKVKEKLSKCNKRTVLGLCHLFDLPGSRAKRKEELVATVMEFLEEPFSAVDMMPSNKKTRGRKRKRGGAGASKSSGGKPLKGPQKMNPEEITLEAYDEVEADGSKLGDNRMKYSDGEMTSNRYEDVNSKEGQFPKEKGNPMPSERIDTSELEKLNRVTSTEVPILTNEQTPGMDPPAKQASTVEGNITGGKVSIRKNVSITPKKRTSKTDRKDKSAGHIVAKGDAKPGKWATKPSRDELRQAVCFILDTANYATTTFGEVVKEVDKYFGKDLSAKKPLIRSLIEEELFRLAEESERKELEEEEATEAKAVAEEAAKERTKDERVESGKHAQADMSNKNQKDKAEIQAGHAGKSMESKKHGNSDNSIAGTEGGISVKDVGDNNGNHAVEGSKDGKAKNDGKNGNNDDEFTEDAKAEKDSEDVNSGNNVEGSKDGKAKEARKNENGNIVEVYEDKGTEEARNRNGGTNVEDKNVGKPEEPDNNKNEDDVGTEDGKAQGADNNEGVDDEGQGAKYGKAKEVMENINTEQDV